MKKSILLSSMIAIFALLFVNLYAVQSEDKKDNTNGGVEYSYEAYDANDNCFCMWNGIEDEWCNCGDSAA